MYSTLYPNWLKIRSCDLTTYSWKTSLTSKTSRLRIEDVIESFSFFLYFFNYNCQVSITKQLFLLLQCVKWFTLFRTTLTRYNGSQWRHTCDVIRLHHFLETAFSHRDCFKNVRTERSLCYRRSRMKSIHVRFCFTRKERERKKERKKERTDKVDRLSSPVNEITAGFFSELMKWV